MLFRKLFFNYKYFFNPPWDTGISPPELMDFLASHPPGRALDLGCGTGTNVITLVQHGWETTGIDFALKAIQIARRKIKKAGIKAEVHVRDASRPGLPGPFDLILDIGCFHGIPEESQSDYIVNLPKLLAPGGTFLLYTFIQTPKSDRGIPQERLEDIGATLNLIQRVDGKDIGERSSAWLTYQKPA